MQYIKDHLRNVEPDELQGPDKEDSCGICVESLIKIDHNDEGKKVKGLPQCDHAYHQECILKWVKQQIDKLQNPDCPLCRALFDPNGKNEEEAAGLATGRNRPN